MGNATSSDSPALANPASILGTSPPPAQLAYDPAVEALRYQSPDNTASIYFIVGFFLFLVIMVLVFGGVMYARTPSSNNNTPQNISGAGYTSRARQ